MKFARAIGWHIPGSNHVQGGYAYAVSEPAFFVIDVTDPRAPRIAGSLQIPSSGIHVEGRYAYVAAGSRGLNVIDISDPVHPAIAGAIETSRSVKKVFVSGNYAYLMERGKGNQLSWYYLKAVDISEFQAERATYEPLTTKLHIPCLQAEGAYYWAGLGITNRDGQIEVQTVNYGAANETAIRAAGDTCGAIDLSSMTMHLPQLNIDGSNFWADLRLVPVEDRWVLEIDGYDALP